MGITALKDWVLGIFGYYRSDNVAMLMGTNKTWVFKHPKRILSKDELRQDIAAAKFQCMVRLSPPKILIGRFSQRNIPSGGKVYAALKKLCL